LSVFGLAPRKCCRPREMPPDDVLLLFNGGVSARLWVP
jgi:hypothetical protein